MDLCSYREVTPSVFTYVVLTPVYIRVLKHTLITAGFKGDTGHGHSPRRACAKTCEK